MKTFDCFTFFNELDLLEFRLKFLDEYVDYFVIAESNLTYNGKPKPYNFPPEKDRYKKWEHKIIYLPVKQSTEGLVFENDKQYNPESAAWKLENEQRNALIRVADRMDDNDIVMVSDLDEIPDPSVLQKIKAPAEPIAFSLLFHYYFLNCQNRGKSRWWKGCIACTAKKFKEITPQGLRNGRDVFQSVSAGGWHFSFLGGVEKIKYKIQSYAHTEYNKDEYVDEKHIEESIRKGADILKREGMFFKFVPLSYYPVKLQKIMKQYPKLLFLQNKNPFVALYYTVRRIIKGNF